jgi:hypothetical protein
MLLRGLFVVLLMVVPFIAEAQGTKPASSSDRKSPLIDWDAYSKVLDMSSPEKANKKAAEAYKEVVPAASEHGASKFGNAVERYQSATQEAARNATKF